MRLGFHIINFLFKLRLKLIYLSASKIGIEFIHGHLVKISAINEKSFVVDLGANLGGFSYEMEKRFKCKILAVEANPDLFKRLKSTNNTTFYNCAISDKDGTVDLVISDNIEASSMFTTIASIWTSGNTVSVSGRKLSSLLDEKGITKVDLLKVDIEGAELMMIDSLSDSELSAFGQISIEFHESLDLSLRKKTLAVIERLKRIGYYTVVTSADKFSDVLFINKAQYRLSNIAMFWYWIHRLVAYKG